MKNYDLVIDGGTTNTRFTLMDGDRRIARIERNVGAANANRIAVNEPLEDTIREVLSDLEESNDCVIENVFASGMITSNAGLYEVPHIKAPAGIEDLIRNIQVRTLPQISQKALFHFIPGIKFEGQGSSGMDMMRGEEVEIFGILKEEDYGKSILFIHFGSHNKLIYYSGNAIQNAVTTLGGELLWAVANHTILKSSVGRLEEVFMIEEKYVKMGYTETRANGISRSLFMGRIQQVIEGADTKQVQSYLYGALMCADLLAFSPFLNWKADKIIIYGRENFLRTFRCCITFPEFQNLSDMEIEEISFQESEKLSVKGIQLIRDSYQREE